MSKSSRKRRDRMSCSIFLRWCCIPLYFLYKNHTILVTLTVPLVFFCLSWGHHVTSASSVSLLFFPLSVHVVLYPFWLPFFFFCSFPLAAVCSYLAPLSCTQHPVCTGAGQTLSLCDAEDISQAITFSAWARYLCNWVLPAVGVLERVRMERKKNGGGGKECATAVGGVGWWVQKGQFAFPSGPH